MKAFLALWRRELSSYFVSPIGYVVLIFFLVFNGISFSFLVDILSQDEGAMKIINHLFSWIFFWIAMMITVPVITMRLFAEEKRSGTIETLMTAPVTDAAVVMSKFAGAMTFFIIMWLPTLVYAHLLQRFSSILTTIDLRPMFAGYLGVCLLGSFYVSIGLLASSLTRNQIVAAIASFGLICVAFFAGFLPHLSSAGSHQELEAYISSIDHMRQFSIGMVDTRPIVLYITGTALMLFATVRVVEARKWK